ncbi:MAG: family 43 glycosylhydrolase [Acidobacteriota bacterium]
MGSRIRLLLPGLIVFLAASCRPADPPSKAAGPGTVPPGSFGDLGNGFYLNPVFPGDYPDPTVLRDGADYYMTHTPHDNKPGLVVWHSRDLVNWRAIGVALTGGEGEIWAPELVKYGDRYYIYYPNQTTRSNCVVTAASPAGPWSAPVDLKIGNIDPGHIVGEDGHRYLYFSDGYMIRLAPDGLSTVGEARKVYDGWTYPEDWLVECFCLESPKLFKRGEYFYLVSAEGGTSGPATGHMAVVARSRSVFGPWRNSPFSPLIRTFSSAEAWWSKGHASFVDTPDGDWYVVYHAARNNRRTRGRMTLLEPVEWTADGWPRLREGVDPSRPIPMPRGENVGSTIDLRGDLETLYRDHRFQAAGSFDPARYAFSGAVLRMKPRGDTPEESAPLLLQAHHDRYEITAEIAAGGPGFRGLMLYYGRGFYYGCGLGPDGVYAFGVDRREKMAGLPGGGSVHFKIVCDDQTVGLYFGPDGKAWKRIEDAVDVSPRQTNLLGGFRSLRPAFFACGRGAAEAEFRDFSYRPL